MLDALRARDPLALAEAYYRTVGAVQAIGRRLLGPGRETEALLRAVYRRLWEAPPAGGALEGWVRAQAFALAAEYLRALGRPAATASAAALLPDLGAPEPGPPDAAEEALAGLDDAARSAVVRAHDRGQAPDEGDGEAAAALERGLAALAGPCPRRGVGGPGRPPAPGRLDAGAAGAGRGRPGGGRRPRRRHAQRARRDPAPGTPPPGGPAAGLRRGPARPRRDPRPLPPVDAPAPVPPAASPAAAAPGEAGQPAERRRRPERTGTARTGTARAAGGGRSAAAPGVTGTGAAADPDLGADPAPEPAGAQDPAAPPPGGRRARRRARQARGLGPGGSLLLTLGTVLGVVAIVLSAPA